MDATGPMSPVRLAEARERIGKVFCQIYGQTESAGVGTLLPKAAHETASLAQLASCGRPAVGACIRLLDDDGADVPVGEWARSRCATAALCSATGICPRKLRKHCGTAGCTPATSPARTTPVD